MALRNWGFIYTSAGADPDRDRSVIDTGSCRTVLVGVERAEQGVEVARSMLADGAQLIELCGGFGPVHAAAVIEAVQGRVPVGTVGYGPEAIDGVHEIFAD